MEDNASRSLFITLFRVVSKEREVFMEKMKKISKYRVSILRPGGNDTMLIKGLIKDPDRKKLINDQMMALFPNVEQVGFYDFNLRTNIATLDMAGGEFCGNALRSLAFLILKAKDGKILAKVSGTKQILKAGVQVNKAYAQMPILKKQSCVKKLKNNLFEVKLEGILFLITKKPKASGPKKLKQFGFNLLEKKKLLYSNPAAGVVFITKKQKANFSIDPIVWVRDIKTLFYESSCASGSAAVGLWAAEKKNVLTELKIKQPSGQSISVSVKQNRSAFKEVLINGSVELLESTTVLLRED